MVCCLCRAASIPEGGDPVWRVSCAPGEQHECCIPSCGHSWLRGFQSEPRAVELHLQKHKCHMMRCCYLVLIPFVLICSKLTQHIVATDLLRLGTEESVITVMNFIRVFVVESDCRYVALGLQLASCNLHAQVERFAASAL